ncbi:MAG: hypothetical protein A2Z20_08970 [Bdellovibrionales bacterium RBG_16_40_8]|nr:MAG: hypothetical protein A2Z20_08970 [Bdellovibrionales bacterium RBG_16_40_8]
MSAKVIGFTTTSSSVVTSGLNSDLHFARERVRELSVLGNPRRFITSPTEIRKISYKKAAGHLRSWLSEGLDSDNKHYDELEAALAIDAIKLREG